MVTAMPQQCELSRLVRALFGGGTLTWRHVQKLAVWTNVALVSDLCQLGASSALNGFRKGDLSWHFTFRLKPYFGYCQRALGAPPELQSETVHSHTLRRTVQSR